LVYLFFTTAVFYVFWKILRPKIKHRQLYKNEPSAKQIKNEIIGSTKTLAIWAVMTIPAFYIVKTGLSANKFGPLGPWYESVLWLVVLLVIHDAYFYWSHRLLHHNLIFKKWHGYHHKSMEPSPFAIFSFDPAEAVISFSIGYLFLLFAPCHVLVTIVWFAIMVFYNLLGHLGFEMFPSWIVKNRITGVSNTSTHHAMHHKHFNCNFGLYFTYWDRLMGTEHPDYVETHAKMVSGGEKV
jgi:sterol desaturase/sphingolipid hydroxylase (fatty acid hydroxylase superfamily)